MFHALEAPVNLSSWDHVILVFVSKSNEKIDRKHRGNSAISAILEKKIQNTKKNDAKSQRKWLFEFRKFFFGM